MAKKEKELTTTFEHGGETYDISFDMDAIDRFERTAGESIMAIYAKSRGMFTIDQLRTLITIGLVKVSGENVDSKERKKLAEELIKTNGYPVACGKVSVAIERDCGFLFQGA